MLRDFLAAIALLGCALALISVSQQLETITTPHTPAATIAAR
jgi:hypothetical protein